MVYNRGAVLTGQAISLKVTFTDDAGNLVDPDSVPDLYIYDSSSDETTITAEAIAKVYTTALVGPVTSTLLSTGYYEYSYTIPAAAVEGVWFDLWVCEIDSVDVHDIFRFTVTQGADLSVQSLGNNTMVVIELDNTITNLAGDENLPESTLYYTTTYSPLYASPDLVRLELGKWVDWIPDDTLALMLHWASKEANFIHGAKAQSWGDLKLARTKFVIYDAALRALMIPGQGQNAGYVTGKTKMLGDLSIKSGNTIVSIEKDILSYIRRMREEWWRSVNAGGNIVAGQGLAPTFAVKGTYDPDRRVTGRLWESPGDFSYPQPSVNRKVRHSGRRRGRWGFYDWEK